MWSSNVLIMSSCHHFILESCHLVTLSSCHLVILSSGHLAILSSCHLISVTACQCVSLSLCKLVSLSVCKLASFSASVSWSLQTCSKKVYFAKLHVLSDFLLWLANSFCMDIQLLESPIPAAAPSQKASHGGISRTKCGIIDPQVSKRPENM